MTERATGVARTREEIEKWNQMMALRFQTGGLLSGISQRLTFFLPSTLQTGVMRVMTQTLTNCDLMNFVSPSNMMTSVVG